MIIFTNLPSFTPLKIFLTTFNCRLTDTFFRLVDSGFPWDEIQKLWKQLYRKRLLLLTGATPAIMFSNLLTFAQSDDLSKQESSNKVKYNTLFLAQHHCK